MLYYSLSYIIFTCILLLQSYYMLYSIVLSIPFLNFFNFFFKWLQSLQVLLTIHTARWLTPRLWPFQMRLREIENLEDDKIMFKAQIKEITRCAQTNAVELFHSYTFVNSLICKTLFYHLRFSNLPADAFERAIALG